MLQRCRTQTHHAWNDYGGRGITVCDRWLVFKNFLADMGDPPAGLQLDRIDNDGNYEPGNCRWATRTVQAQNRQSTRLITFNGETKCMSEWARQLGVQPRLIAHRLKAGWTVEEALLRPTIPRRACRNRFLIPLSNTPTASTQA